MKPVQSFQTPNWPSSHLHLSQFSTSLHIFKKKKREKVSIPRRRNCSPYPIVLHLDGFAGYFNIDLQIYSDILNSKWKLNISSQYLTLITIHSASP